MPCLVNLALKWINSQKSENMIDIPLVCNCEKFSSIPCLQKFYSSSKLRKNWFFEFFTETISFMEKYLKKNCGSWNYLWKFPFYFITPTISQNLGLCREIYKYSSEKSRGKFGLVLENCGVIKKSEETISLDVLNICSQIFQFRWKIFAYFDLDFFCRHGISSDFP